MKERVAIITGAASGIGLAVSEALAGAGDRVVMADINPEAGAREAEKLGGLFVQADLSRRADCKKLVDAALEKFGRVDILVNNAGIQHVSPGGGVSRRQMGLHDRPDADGPFPAHPVLLAVDEGSTAGGGSSTSTRCTA